MYEYKCQMCGATFQLELPRERKFCGKKCYGAFKHLKHNDLRTMQTEPEMGKLKNIHDNGAVNLISAIVGRASEDILHYPPTSCYRIDAKQFFKSEYFATLTNLDGKKILRELQAEYERRKKKGGKKIDR